MDVANEEWIDLNCGSPLVTVICITYNHIDFIDQCLAGIVSQKTDFPFEVIVHDDASTDGTGDVVRRYQERYPNLIRAVIQEENQYSKGIPVFREFMLPLARGKYFAWCEGDDYWCDSDKLQLQVNCLEAHSEIAACVHNTDIFRHGKGFEGKACEIDEDGMISLRCLIGQRGVYHTSSLMNRASAYVNMPPFVNSVKGVGDYPLRVYLALTGGVYLINRTMSVYRLNTPGSWSSRMNRNTEAAVKMKEQIIAMLEDANEWSNGRYETAFERAVIEQEYEILNLHDDFKAMADPRFSGERRRRSLKHRMMVAASRYAPKCVTAMIRHLRGR